MSIDHPGQPDDAARPAPDRTADSPAGVRVGLAQRVVAVHADHTAAEQTVRTLAAAGFPAHRVTVVGQGLTRADTVTGDVSAADVAARSALSGLVVGALVGPLLGLFDLATPSVSVVWLAVNAAILGAVLGAVTGLLGYALTRGRRSVATPSRITATRYEVQVDADLADQAVRTLDDE